MTSRNDLDNIIMNSEIKNIYKDVLIEHYNQGNIRFIITAQEILKQFRDLNETQALDHYRRSFILRGDEYRNQLENIIIKKYDKTKLLNILNEIKHIQTDKHSQPIIDNITEIVEKQIKEMSLTKRNKIYNNYNNNNNMIYNMNKNIKIRSNRLHYIANKVKGENASLAKNIVELYDSRKISQSDKLEELLWELRFSNGKVVKNKANRLINKYTEIEPITHRLRQKTTVRTEKRVVDNTKVDYKNLDKSKMHIELDLEQKYYFDKNLQQIYPIIKNKLINSINHLFETKKVSNCKIILGCVSTWIYIDVDDEGDNPRTEEIKQPVKTNYKTIYSKEKIKDVLDDLFDIMINKFENLTQRDTKWSLKNINNIFIEVFKINAIRGSSYIPTPDKFKNAKCGLINIQNDDQECFKWCMKYHQSTKDKHSDRITVLKKLDDKYNYDNINFPAGLDDAEQFEKDNTVSIFIYNINSENQIVREKIGNSDFITNDIIYLLRIENEEKSHYVYIKHLSRFINLSYMNKNIDMDCFCPYCNKQQKENFTEHIKKCYKSQFNDGTLLKLPEKDTFMKFENFKNKLVRPFIIYADTESTLAPNNDENKINKHIINSCCFYFVCTFDSSRNELFTFVGDDCLNKMIIKARHLSCCFIFTLQSYYLLPLILRKQITNSSIFKPKNKKEWETIAN
jgi:hypothetical protein